MSTDPHWLDRLHLVDHHCHGLVPEQLDRVGFEDLITESDVPAPAGTTFFDTQLGFAIRQHCAPVLDLAPFATPEDYLARRSELGSAKVNGRLMRAAGLGDLLVETGYRPDDILSPAQMGDLAGAGHAEVVRLERIAEEVAAQVPAADFAAAFRARLDADLATAVGVKSIAAYRTGFDISPERPTDDEVRDAVARWTGVRAAATGERPAATGEQPAATGEQPAATSGNLRLDDPVLVRFGLWEAIERAVPIQLHVGYGDPHVDLHRCNPLLLTDLLRAARGSGATFLLLHCYPFHREAGYLAHVFEHTYCDVGLAITYTGVQSAQIIAESLELTPFHKSLFSSDAFGVPELFHLGALLFRRGLGRALATWGQDWPLEEQQRVAGLVGSENARRVYGLDQVTTTTFGRQDR